MTPDEIKAHIWSKCHECGDCLLWDGAVNDAGVPQMRLPGTREVFSVRRLLLTALGQDIAGKIASTRCGHQLCMAEQHVTPMTRQQLQKRSGKKLVGNLARAAKLAATRRKTAKLTMEQVQEMRQLRAEGVTTHEAAKRYGITQGAAAKVMRGDSWRDYSSPYTQLMTRQHAMTARCTRCNRKLKAPTPSGMGETCERHVLGPRQRAKKAPKTMQVKRDMHTPDLFSDAFGWPWMVAA